MTIPETGLRIEVSMRRDRLPYPRPGQNSSAVPDTSIKEELAQLEFIPRTEVCAAAHISLASGHEIQIVVTELQRPSDIGVKVVG